MFKSARWAGLALVLVASPCLGALSIVSSSRSVSATAETRWLGMPGPTPGVPLASNASPTHAAAGPFDYSTGILTARAPLLLTGGFWIETTATASAALTSLVSPSVMSGSTVLQGASDGRSSQPSETHARVLYNVLFTVDAPTPFTLDGTFVLPVPSNPLPAGVDYDLKVVLNGFLDLHYSWPRPHGAPNSFAVSGIFLPESTYVLNVEYSLDTTRYSASWISEGEGRLNFALVVPEPGLVMPVLGLVLGAWRRRRP